jgi:hypothetical protein
MLKQSDENFPGFELYYYKNFFIYPHLMQEYWHTMSGSEQKVMDFILRRTIGWRKIRDSISLSQFQNGANRGKNTGTGLSISQIQRAIKGLEEKGFIKVLRFGKGKLCTFELVMAKIDYTEINEKAFKAFNDIDFKSK